jgi:metal-responsive CopG/Arc/MetJ family transcriptional regulator
MDTETVRLNITLPRIVSQALNEIAGPRQRSKFIVEALTLRIEQKNRERLEKLLEEGYKATVKEDLEISKEFEAVDLEGWDDY